MAKEKARRGEKTPVETAKMGSVRKSPPQKKAAKRGSAEKSQGIKGKTRPAKKAVSKNAQPKQAAARQPATKQPQKRNVPPAKTEVVAKLQEDMIDAFEEVANPAGTLRKKLRALSQSQLCAYWEEYCGDRPVSERLATEESKHRLIEKHIQALQEEGRERVETLEEEEGEDEYRDDENEEIREALELLDRVIGGT